MDEQTVAELEALRTRAYGPDADLANDPDALRRLQDLEERARALRSSEAAAEAPPAAEPIDAASVGDDPEPVVADGAALEQPGRAEPLRLWWTRRRVTATWIAALVVTLVVVAAVSSAFTYRLQADPREVAALAVDPGAELPAAFGGSELDGRVFAQFYGLLPMAIDYGDPRVGGPCLSVVPADSIDGGSTSFAGPAFGACGAGSFPAAVSFLVTSDLPEKLRDRFPEGTGLQFILDGEPGRYRRRGTLTHPPRGGNPRAPCGDRS